MASQTPPMMPVKLVIDPEGDLTVRLIDVETTIDPDTEKESKVVTTLAMYRVCRNILKYW